MSRGRYKIKRIPRKVECQHIESQHYAHGLCKKCYKTEKAKTYRVVQRANGTSWKIKNYDYARLKEREVKLRKYGITIEQFDIMMTLQNGVCALCKRPPKTYRLNIDHDHVTGRVRGLLCYRCNKFLVIRRHTASILRKAADYVESDFDGRYLNKEDF